MKNTGVRRSEEQFEALKRRVADLEAKISSYNDEVNRLNEEGKAIVDSQTVK